MADVITVDFDRPMPLFVLPAVVLLPHSRQRLHVFEPRYRQMVEHCLERGHGHLMRAGQIALAVVQPSAIAEGAWKEPAPLRDAVCVGHMVEHNQLADGRHNITLHGICRARILTVDEPGDERLYRQAVLRPLEPPGRAFPPMHTARRAIREVMAGPRLRRMNSIRALLNWISRDDLPTHAMVEIVGDAIVRSECDRYRLLEEPDPWARARILRDHLLGLDRLVGAADRQRAGEWPKGLSWN
ncbi:MAG: LON peptidase substrate-binding domain-containing protein [Phycisphaeraceae bacterium]|nr:LON peptidase substrate-binding domain-containing protein [Phycisphaeraceae bacterium]